MATKRAVKSDNDKLNAETQAVLKTMILKLNLIQAQTDALTDEYNTLAKSVLDLLESQPVQIDRVEFDEVRASVVRKEFLNTDGWNERYPRLWARLVGYGAELVESRKEDLAVKYATLKETIERAKEEDKDSTGMITKAIEESTEIKTSLRITRK